jgi:hypothetical protein
MKYILFALAMILILPQLLLVMQVMSYVHQGHGVAPYIGGFCVFLLICAQALCLHFATDLE